MITELINGFSANDLKVISLARALKELPQAETALSHVFIGDVYCRQIFIPAGTLIISQLHLTEHSFLLSKGTIRLWTSAVGLRELSAPFCGITHFGNIRMAIAITDCTWTTFHLVGNERNVKAIEKSLGIELNELTIDESNLEFEAIEFLKGLPCH